MRTFAEVFASALAKSGLTQTAFAKQAGVAQPFVSQVAKGLRKPSLDNVERWAELLGLQGEERARFLRVGRLLHTPPEIRDEYLKLRAQSERAKRG